jgi:glutathione S-transferase
LKLFHSATSPFVRKVMACAIARGIEGQITEMPTNPHESPAALLAANPLSKVPCLITVDGMALFDSPVICEFLDSIGGEIGMFPQGASRWRALRLQAIGDGIMDAAVLHRGESQRPREDARDAVMVRQTAAVTRALDLLETDPPSLHLDIGSLTVACALEYLDLRMAHLNWREGRPRLAGWLAGIAGEPALARTAPPAA